MYKIAVVGDYESIAFFTAVGFETFTAANAEEARTQVLSLRAEGYGIIFVTEQYLAQMSDIIKSSEEELLPAIVAIPTNKARLGFGEKLLKGYIQRAIGADMI